MTFVGASSNGSLLSTKYGISSRPHQLIKTGEPPGLLAWIFSPSQWDMANPSSAQYASVYRGGHRDLAVTLVILNVPDGAGTGSWKILRGSRWFGT
jgi:hypothetical protein